MDNAVYRHTGVNFQSVLRKELSDSQPVLLPHDQVGRVDVVHLLTRALQAVFEPQHRLLQVLLGHSVQLVNGLALGLQDDFRVSIDVGDLLHFYLQCCEHKRGQDHSSDKEGINPPRVS